jgi:MFS family permease
LFLFAFFYWETRVERKGNDPLLRPSLLGNKQLTGGLIMFFFQYMVQMGVFFTIPLFLSVVLELDALSTGLRILPLSLGLLLTAILIPRLLPRVSPRLIVRLGMAGLLAGTVTLVAGITPDAQAGVVVIPLLVIGLGMGALASQLGAATVSSVSESLGGEVGGLQNTATNLGASLGTALVGSVLIAALTTGAVNGIIASPVVPDSVKQEMNVHLTGSLPFISETDLAVALDKTTLAPDVMQEIARVNRQAQDRGLRTALSVVALFAVAAFFFTGRIPKRPPGAAEPESG